MVVMLISDLDQQNCRWNISEIHNWAREPTYFKQEFDDEHKDKEEDKPDGKWLKGVKVVMENKFLFLDMKMSWTKEGDLRFDVFNKKKQAIKYVDKGSTHHP
eukprot:5178297-Ditylum_brightwellii.AAC.1